MIRAEAAGQQKAVALPNINSANARLPATYEQAKQALAACNSLDECKDWADKAAALASYARQADDDTLQKHALRIQARAVRRCGELLKTYDGRGGDRTKTDAADTFAPSQKKAARDAGLSERQQVTAVRVANVPEEKFTAAVDGPEKVTVTSLADMGRRFLTEPKPAGFAKATHVIGEVSDFAEFCRENDPIEVAGGVLDHEIVKVRQNVSTIDSWLDRFVVNLKGVA